MKNRKIARKIFDGIYNLIGSMEKFNSNIVDGHEPLNEWKMQARPSDVVKEIKEFEKKVFDSLDFLGEEI